MKSSALLQLTIVILLVALSYTYAADEQNSSSNSKVTVRECVLYCNDAKVHTTRDQVKKCLSKCFEMFTMQGSAKLASSNKASRPKAVKVQSDAYQLAITQEQLQRYTHSQLLSLISGSSGLEGYNGGYSGKGKTKGGNKSSKGSTAKKLTREQLIAKIIKNQAKYAKNPRFVKRWNKLLTETTTTGTLVDAMKIIFEYTTKHPEELL